MALRKQKSRIKSSGSSRRGRSRTDERVSPADPRVILPKVALRGIERIAHPVKSRLGKVTLERNERTVDFPPEVVEDVRSLVTSFVLRCYPEMDDFYEALARWSGFAPEQLLATDGADGGLHRVFATYVSEGQNVVIFSPSYAMYPIYCQMYGAKVQELTYDEKMELAFDTVLASAAPGTRLIALVNPNQPIESCFTEDQIRRLAERCAAFGILLLVDEAYYHFCDITAAPLVREFDNVVVARTLSKAFGLAGLRIGYLIAAPSVIIALRALKPIYEISHLNAAIAAYFLSRPQIMENYVNAVRAGRERAARFFASYGCQVHGRHSNTILVSLPSHLSAPTVSEALRAAGWLVRAETRAPASNHLRITLGPPDQMKELCGMIEPYFKGERRLD